MMDQCSWDDRRFREDALTQRSLTPNSAKSAAKAIMVAMDTTAMMYCMTYTTQSYAQLLTYKKVADIGSVYMLGVGHEQRCE